MSSFVVVVVVVVVCLFVFREGVERDSENIYPVGPIEVLKKSCTLQRLNSNRTEN